jgi:hypothetical protein
MKFSKIVSAGALALALSLGAWNPIADTVKTAGAATLTTVTGTFKVVISIKVVSVIPTDDLILCKVTASVSGADSNTTEAYQVAATRSTGAATCTVTIPYSWELESPTTDTVNLAYDITNSEAALLEVTTPPVRETIQNITKPPISIPANGTVTTKDVSVTM